MSDGGGWKAGELADTLRNGDFEADIDAVLSDDEIVGDCIMRLDDGPLRDLLSEQTSTDMLRRARRESDVASMSAATGLSDSKIDATGYQLLVNSIKPAAHQVLLKGPKGSGKTTKALDIARHLHAEMDGKLNVLTNIKKSETQEIEHDAVDYADTVSGMLEWVRDTPGEKLVIGDEWSSTVNSHAHGGGKVRETFSQFINALRKGEGGSTRLLVIGHEHDTDIAAIIRNQSDIVITADGKKKEGLIDQATVYKGYQDYTAGNDWVTIRGMQDVPQRSPWSVSTNYFATFEIDLDEPQKQIQKGKLIENWEQYQDDSNEATDGGRERITCRGKRTDGGDCKQQTDHISGYCQPHRDQWDGETPDPRHGGDL
mgnify:CR=1 FL=1